MPFNLFSSFVAQSVDQFRIFRRAFITLIILFALMFVSQAWSNGKIADFWRAIQPSAAAQSYTELAFNNVNNLPTVVPNNNQLGFSFMLHNVEGKTVSYPYIIAIQTDGNTQVVKQGIITLTANARASITEKISIQSSSQRQKVLITLPTKQQSIDFWLKGSKS